MLLEDLRKCYDAVLSMDIVAAEPAPVDEVAVADTPHVPIVHAHTPELQETAAPVSVAEEVQPVEPELEQTDNEPETEVKAEVPAEAPVHVSEAPVAAETKEEQPAPRPLLGKPDAKPNNESILAGKLNRKPITDLSSGIPLNEKFGIIRNLFSGNASDFGDAVLKLNNSKSAAELKHYFQLLTQRRDWDMENESYQIFLGYVERKAGSLQTSEADTDH